MPAYCKACGGDAVNHPLQFLSVLFNAFLTPLLPIAGAASRFRGGRLHARLFEVLARAGLVVLLKEHDDKTLLLDQVLWNEAKRRYIRMREFRPLGSTRNTFIAELPNGVVIDFDGVPYIPGYRSAWWLNDKSVMKKRFAKLSFPVARGGRTATSGGALMLFHKLAARGREAFNRLGLAPHQHTC